MKPKKEKEQAIRLYAPKKLERLLEERLQQREPKIFSEQLVDLYLNRTTYEDNVALTIQAILGPSTLVRSYVARILSGYEDSLRTGTAEGPRWFGSPYGDWMRLCDTIYQANTTGTSQAFQKARQAIVGEFTD